MDWLKSPNHIKENQSIWSSLDPTPYHSLLKPVTRALHLQTVSSSAVSSSQKGHVLSTHYSWIPQVIHVSPIKGLQDKGK